MKRRILSDIQQRERKYLQKNIFIILQKMCLYTMCDYICCNNVC